MAILKTHPYHLKLYHHVFSRRLRHCPHCQHTTTVILVCPTLAVNKASHTIAFFEGAKNHMVHYSEIKERDRAKIKPDIPAYSSLLADYRIASKLSVQAGGLVGKSHLFLPFLPREFHRIGVNDHHIIPAVVVGTKGRLMLAPDDGGDLRRQPTDDLRRIDQKTPGHVWAE